MGARPPEDEIAAVAERVFFQPTGKLPRGKHSLSPDRVQAAQRERMLIAVTELLAAHGYRGFKVGDIATRAGVSLGAFYDCFSGKDDCIFQGYDRFIEVLLGRMISVELHGQDQATLTGELIDGYLQALDQDLVVARAYQLEIDMLGDPARTRRRDALTLFANHIRQRVAEFTPDGQPPADIPPIAYIGVVYAARQLVSDELASPEPDLARLAAQLREWATDALRVRS